MNDDNAGFSEKGCGDGHTIAIGGGAAGGDRSGRPEGARTAPRRLAGADIAAAAAGDHDPPAWVWHAVMG